MTLLYIGIYCVFASACYAFFKTVYAHHKTNPITRDDCGLVLFAAFIWPIVTPVVCTYLAGEWLYSRIFSE